MAAALGGRLAAAGFRVLSVDRPGHGWSDRVGGDAGASPAVQAAALRAASEKLGVRRALVVVHSLGGLAGLALALDHPDFVRALVLIAPVSHPWPGGVAWYYGLGARRLLGAPFRWLVALPAGRLLMRRAVAGVFAPNPAPPRLHRGDAAPARASPAPFPRQLRGRRPRRGRGRGDVPALSARSALPSRWSPGIPTASSTPISTPRVSPATSPQARLTTLEGVGHSPHHIAPDRIVAIILAAEARAARRRSEPAGSAERSRRAR